MILGFIDLAATNSDMASLVRNSNGILTSICQLLAVFVIAVGVIRALVIFIRDLLLKPHSPEAFQKSRLAMGYSFSLGLSFLVGASILKTMLSSRWDEIARLATIIAIRTVLNYFLFNSPGQRPHPASPNGSVPEASAPEKREAIAPS